MKKNELEKSLTELKKVETNNLYEELIDDFSRNSVVAPEEKRKAVQIKSVVKYLKDNKKITDDFLIMFSTLSLEEIIYLKLELCSDTVKNRLFGFALKRTLLKIVTDVIDTYALTHFRTNRDVANFLGITMVELNNVKEVRKKRRRIFKEYWV